MVSSQFVHDILWWQWFFQPEAYHLPREVCIVIRRRRAIMHSIRG
jgi:hypothetical protein